jgi:hypothetical protein
MRTYNMTEVEQAQECITLIKDAIEFVLSCANEDRKILKEKNVNGHYVKALNELTAVKTAAETRLKRAELKNGQR